MKIEKYISLGEVLPCNLLKELEKHFQCVPFFYAVLDYAVVLGKYEKGELHGGFTQEGAPCVKPIAVEEIQEIRVFDKDKEWKALNMGDVFAVRLKNDLQEEHESDSIDEEQKIWGMVKYEVGIPGWCLLESGRGSRILLPQKGNIGEEKAVVIRKYYEIPDEDMELFRFIDERLYDFKSWKKQKEDGSTVRREDSHDEQEEFSLA